MPLAEMQSKIENTCHSIDRQASFALAGLFQLNLRRLGFVKLLRLQSLQVQSLEFEQTGRRHELDALCVSHPSRSRS